MARICAKFLTDDDLRKFAEGYLAAVHPEGAIPTPIDEIVMDEGIDVVPMNGLYARGHEAFTSRDRKTIYIDEAIFKNPNANRYRYSIAHELAHVKLHEHIFEAADYTDFDGWKSFLTSIRDEDLRWIERQAYMVAGYLLVPVHDLSREYNHLANQLKAGGMDIRSLPPHLLRIVAKQLGTVFEVSTSVIHRRAVKDGLWEWDALPGG